ncbi:MAG: cation diffusion facilitator family transporter [Methanotrichaceae archaeon]|nr:cation diffusion facilitator family transporter [Methanotrichaceae archaeon]
MENSEARDKRKSNAALLSVFSNSSLVALKLVVGVMIGSISVISEAIHSGMDLLAAVIALFAVRTSGKPADEDHPFGHGKVENISGTVEAMLIFLAAAWIIFEAIKKLRNPEQLEEPMWGVAVMLISVAANIFVSMRLFKVGEETDSMALKADAWHLRTDVYTSLGVMVGLAIILVGGLIAPDVNLQWVDPLAAIAVALLIIRTAYHLTVEASRDLVDIRLPDDEVEEIRKDIMVFAPTIRGIHKLRTRKAGASRFVEFHIKVDASMSVDESHRLADMITCSIKHHYPGSMVTIHIEPCNCAIVNERSCGCLLSDEDKRALITKS